MCFGDLFRGQDKKEDDGWPSRRLRIVGRKHLRHGEAFPFGEGAAGGEVLAGRTVVMGGAGVTRSRGGCARDTRMYTFIAMSDSMLVLTSLEGM